MAAVLEELPARTHAALSNRPSDLLNVMFIGSRDELTTAFEAAGWIQPTADDAADEYTENSGGGGRTGGSRGSHVGPAGAGR